MSESRGRFRRLRKSQFWRSFFRIGIPRTTRDRVAVILDDLERHMVFLYRNDRGEVEWAYPATAASTPHHTVFSTGERLDAA